MEQVKENHCQCPQSVQLAGGRPPWGGLKTLLTEVGLLTISKSSPSGNEWQIYTVTFRLLVDGTTHGLIEAWIAELQS